MRIFLICNNPKPTMSYMPSPALPAGIVNDADLARRSVHAPKPRTARLGLCGAVANA